MAERIVPAENFCQTLDVNVNNPSLSDKAFRELVRNTLPIVVYSPVNKGYRDANGGQYESQAEYLGQYSDNYHDRSIGPDNYRGDVAPR